MHRTIVPIIVCRIHVRAKTHARYPNVGFVLTPVLYFSFPLTISSGFYYFF